MDASTLLAVLQGFLPGDDERLHRSVMALSPRSSPRTATCCATGPIEPTTDGLSGTEGTFVICSFCLLPALAIVGEHQRALDVMERLLREASSLGLYAEVFDSARPAPELDDDQQSLRSQKTAA